MRPCVSVVLPTRSRSDLLVRCLDALANQRLPVGTFEVLIVDDGAGAHTRELVERFNRIIEPRGNYARYLSTGGGRGPAAARNLGWRAASADVVAFTDDDCVPEPTWLACGLMALGPDIDGVSGRVVVPLQHRPTDYERDVSNLERSEFVTANVLYRKLLLERLGGFDETFRLAWREDSDLVFRAMDDGARLTYEPRAVVVHPVRRARWGISAFQQRKSMYNALLFRKHPARYRTLVQRSPPWRYYRITACAVIAIAAHRRTRRTSAAFTAAWLLLTARFAAERLRGASHAPAHVLEMLVTSAVIPPLSIFWRLYGALRFRTPFL